MSSQSLFHPEIPKMSHSPSTFTYNHRQQHVDEIKLAYRHALIEDIELWEATFNSCLSCHGLIFTHAEYVVLSLILRDHVF